MLNRIKGTRRVKTYAGLCHCVVLISLWVWSASAYGINGQQAEPASISAHDFTESLGVNIHLEYTDGRYANVGAVLKDLQYLGLSYVRDGVPARVPGRAPGDGLDAWDSLASAGIRFDIPVPGNADIQQQIRQIGALLKHHPGMVSAIEGPNEINNWAVEYHGEKGEQAARDFQHDLYRSVHAEHAMREVPVYYLTGGEAVDLASSSDFADYENAHPYPHFGQQPTWWLQQDFKRFFKSSRPMPKVITETGYYTIPWSRGDWGGVDAQTQATLLLNLLFDAVELGISRTYIYQLLDPYPDPEGKSADSNLGLFFLDNRPKPSAVVIHKLTNFLQDRPSVPRKAPVKITAGPASIHRVFISKSDGSNILALWNEVNVWDSLSSKPLVVPSVEIQLAGMTAGSYQWIDLVDDRKQQLQPQNGMLRLQVPPHVVFLVIPAETEKIAIMK